MVVFGAVFVTLVTLAGSMGQQWRDYSGHELLQLNFRSVGRSQQLDLLLDDLDVWAEGPTDLTVLVVPEQKNRTLNTLQELGVKYGVIENDLQKRIVEDYISLVNVRSAGADFDFARYHSFAEIEHHILHNVSQSQYVKVVSIGTTVEGRAMHQVQISVPSTAKKQLVWIDCGTHAREWVTIATCLWGINHLLTGYENFDKNVTSFLDSYDIHITPVTNPDGYIYSQTSDRFWRKNRGVNAGSDCKGVDLNRNFNAYFGVAGTSNRACSSIYRGPSPASEPETRNIQQAIALNANNTVAMFSIHAYGQLMLYPHGHTEAPAKNHAQLAQYAENFVSNLQSVSGTKYVQGPIAIVIYQATGSTVDYANSLGIPYTYTPELRPDFKNGAGFSLPTNQILATAKETWYAILNTPLVYTPTPL